MLNEEIMNNNNKNIDNLFEQAKKVKSPISIDKARNLIEINDFNKNIKTSFFRKKGIRIMLYSSLIIGTLIVLNLTSGLFYNTNNHKSSTSNTVLNVEKSNNNLAIQKTEPQSNETVDKLSTSNIKKNTTQKQEFKKQTFEHKQTNFNSENKNYKLNNIQLTNEELEEFGIIFSDKNSKIPMISFWNNIQNKIKNYSSFTSEKSTFKDEIIEPSDTTKYIKINPNIITDFNGRNFLIGTNVFSSEKLSKINKDLVNFNNLTFNKELFPKQIPQNIINRIDELNNLLNVYYYNPNDLNETKISDNIKELYDYYHSISMLDSAELSESKSKYYNSNYTQVMVIYNDKELTNDEYEFIKEYEKKGVKVIFEKRRLSMNSHLESINEQLADNIRKHIKSLEQDEYINSMIAIRIPTNNKHTDGFILWYYPSQELIDALPQRYRETLTKEFNLSRNNEAICGLKIDTDTTYLNIWRLCSGAIENLKVYPNPVVNVLKVQFYLKEARMISYSLYNTDGNKIKDLSKAKNYNTGLVEYNCDLSSIPNGIYMLVATSDKGEQVVSRIIKNK